METNTLARALGWFSIGLGVLEVVGGEALARALGMEKQSTLLRAYGLRESAVGIGILAAREPVPPGWLWGRFGGDILDIATLLNALEDSPKSGNVAIALAAVGGVTVLDYLCAQRLSSAGHDKQTSDSSSSSGSSGPVPAGAPEGESFITISRSASDLYALWNDPKIFAQVMGGFAEVAPATNNPDQMQWTVAGPLGIPLTWNTHMVESVPGASVRWESVPGADVPNEGQIRFSQPAPGNRGTEVALRFRFDPPGGLVGDAAAKLLGFAPGMLASGILHRFKALVETGEIPTLSKNVSARGVGDTA